MTVKENLIVLFEIWAKEVCISFIALPPSGSYREYYRLQGKTKKVVGVYNKDLKENKAFIKFSEHFQEHNLNVPQIYAKDLNSDIYLVEDLGDITLFSYINEKNQDYSSDGKLMEIYKKIIAELPKFQLQAGKDLDYSYCYPRKSFDKQSMMWDLSYFKYYFLKLAKIPFDEQLLENDYHKFSDYLLEVNHDYFLYRDFQSRNIMLYQEKPFFIDYQGGRKGALQYDIASLLYDAKANIPESARKTLLDYYISELQKYISINNDEFIGYYYGYVLIRIMQAMGAYGFRGYYEKKVHFLQSIPYALSNLKWIIDHIKFPINIPSLYEVFNNIINSENIKKINQQITYKSSNLKVSIFSFSYRNSIPEDKTGNGGGFVFDCRVLPNPGKLDEYKKSNGLDNDVIKYFKNEQEVSSFINHICNLVDISVEKYLSRGFTNLMISFGCTGGQHRSVYCAEELKSHLEKKYAIEISVCHTEKNQWC
ncbi:MAG: RNase adapter RapZ [Bacteroidota bacterium]